MLEATYLPARDGYFEEVRVCRHSFRVNFASVFSKNIRDFAGIGGTHNELSRGKSDHVEKDFNDASGTTPTLAAAAFRILIFRSNMA